ncbi:putative DNA-binding domain protein [anaerobic digester metagenome]
MDDIEFRLLKRIAGGESQTLDFKFAVNDSRKIARSMSAFANTDGGSLLIGVKDNGKLAGIRSEEEIYMAEAAATMHCEPEVHFNSILYQIQNKEILEIIIPEGGNVLTLAPDESGNHVAYLRYRDANYIAGQIYERVWAKRNQKQSTHLRMDEYHKAVLELMERKGIVSLEQVMQDLGLKRGFAASAIERLILLDAADFKLTENGMHYCLKGNP